MASAELSLLKSAQIRMNRTRMVTLCHRPLPLFKRRFEFGIKGYPVSLSVAFKAVNMHNISSLSGRLIPLRY